MGFTNVSLNLLRCLCYNNDTRRSLIFILVFSAIIAWLKPSIETGIYCNTLSVIAGFNLAAIAILFNMPFGIIKELNKDLKEGEHCCCLNKSKHGMSNSKPIDDLFASICLGVVVPMLGLIAYILKSIHLSLDIDHNMIKCMFIVFSLMWSLHISFHLFTLRSFLTIK